MTYNDLRVKDSWTREDIIHIRQLQELLKEENKRLSNENWDKQIEDLQDIYNESKKLVPSCQFLFISLLAITEIRL